MNRLRRAIQALWAVFASFACAPKDAPAPEAAQAPVSVGHVMIDSATGIAIDLPATWKGRYRAVRGVSERTEGLLDEVALRFVRADSGLQADSALLTARVFSQDGYRRIDGDSLALQRFGALASRDPERDLVLTIRIPAGNPFAAGTVDAAAFDSLMIALFSRPMRSGIGKPLLDTAAVRQP